jgi:hypothetical protein
MENIKIIRLKNGEDIVGQVINSSGIIDSYDVIEPMTVDIDYRGKEAGLIMNHWLPVQLVKTNEAVISKSDILCFVEPTDAFCEYYTNTVEKIHDLLKAKNLVDELSDDELNDVMDAFEELKSDGFRLH